MTYGSARTSYLKLLDAIHYQLHCGKEPLLDLRLNKPAQQYIVKLKADIDNPTFDCVFQPQYKHL